MTAALLISATLIAAACDVRTRRIPNVLCVTLALGGLVTHIPEGIVPTLFAIVAMLLAFLLGTFAFSAGWFGGGDVKLVSACCAVAGFPGSVALVLYIFLAGAFLALVTAALRGRIVALVRSAANVARHGVATEGATVPYGVAIAAGSITYVISLAAPSMRFPL